MKLILIALLSAATAGAQISTKEAYSRLEKKHAAATQPATSDELRERVAALETLVKLLEDENAELRKRLGIGPKEKVGALDAPSLEIAKAIRAHRLAVGMTLAQANESLGSEGRLISEDAVRKSYQWSVFPVAGESGRSVEASFVGGKLQSWDGF